MWSDNAPFRLTEATARLVRSALERLASCGRLAVTTDTGFSPDVPAFEHLAKPAETAHPVFADAVLLFALDYFLSLPPFIVQSGE